MKIMSRLATLCCLSFVCAAPAAASETEDLETMLHAFLAGSSTEAAHASFWAEDLIYTSSAGLRFGKADIMAGFEDVDDTQDVAPTMIFSGDEVDIRVHDDVAIVAFRLVGTPAVGSDETEVLYYFNTGTFMKREGVWTVIAWQATKIPPG